MEEVNKQLKEERLKAASTKKVNVPHHVDKKHVEQTMAGFFDTFSSIFGP